MSSMFCAGAGSAELVFSDRYFPNDGYSAIHDPLHCKARILTKGSVRGGFVTLELPSIRPWELTDELRAYAARLISAPYENTWLVMTHDLSAPHVPPEEPGRTLHMDMLRRAILQAVEQAGNSLRLARLSYGESRCHVNANRDMESVDGWWVGIDGKGPSDKRLSLLRFSDEMDRPIAALYSYAIKSSVLEETVMSDGLRYASGDVTGRAGMKAEETLGCPVLFVMGAAGDQVPRRKAHYLSLDGNRRFKPVDLREEGYAALESLSDELALSIRTAFDAANQPMDDPSLAFDHDILLCAGKKPYPKTLPKPPVLQYDYEPDQDQTLDIWRIRMGESVLLGVKPEVTTPIFHSLEGQCPVPHLLMATLVNGGQGYIATDWDYERFTYPGLNTPFQPGTDSAFIARVANLFRD